MRTVISRTAPDRSSKSDGGIAVAAWTVGLLACFTVMPALCCRVGGRLACRLGFAGGGGGGPLVGRASVAAAVGVSRCAIRSGGPFWASPSAGRPQEQRSGRMLRHVSDQVFVCHRAHGLADVRLDVTEPEADQVRDGPPPGTPSAGRSLCRLAQAPRGPSSRCAASGARPG